MNVNSSLTRPLLAAVRMLLVMTVVLGVLYPAAVLLAGRALPARADGSVVHHDGRAVGSALFSQETTDPRWFHPRPSATDHDGASSGGSNLGTREPAQLEVVRERLAAVRQENPDAAGPVPPDAVTASGSGLDPHISPEYAEYQLPRVAAANDLPVEQVRALVEEHTDGPSLGFVGAPRVNVLLLNLALADAVGTDR
ncbi:MULTISPECIES: potassium-transporting ATPase subunit KdpC [Kytococcus]|uniref:Potassium-transporting ATPase KdpC subunit n=1 Tax=Kytococcus schroeteri TaxID=138300 RepID=A0A2I1PBQ4_9MICO|nr:MULTISPECIES: potassium-transporting ATPase subunit KdpC [Kytococcus]OFS14455.1 hypothetical protein HMPREF3099_04115 [Kytococcus sp. HMSC28H12]PKZ42063.1 potassium-transporting ATPase subunit KdpC [Kytococcus schroeteri]